MSEQECHSLFETGELNSTLSILIEHISEGGCQVIEVFRVGCVHTTNNAFDHLQRFISVANRILE